MSVIELKQLTKVYETGETSFKALDDINLTVNESEMIAIMGESGAGKSTMLNMIGLLDRPTSGEYHLSGTPVENMTDDELSETRNQKIGFVFQSFFLLPRLTALQNVALPLLYRGVDGVEAKERAIAMLKKINIDRLAYHKPAEMSGGQQQRVALSRALIGEPDVILADEPTGALDSKTSQEVMDLFKKLNSEEKKTIVVVTHDPEVGEQCQRVVRVQDGKIVHEGHA